TKTALSRHINPQWCGLPVPSKTSTLRHAPATDSTLDLNKLFNATRSKETKPRFTPQLNVKPNRFDSCQPKADIKQWDFSLENVKN
ncbi:MAG TPA: hypothetical protein VJA40_05320, partial [archaeon]|nr:hypothetical protein [archaeon]